MLVPQTKAFDKKLAHSVRSKTVLIHLIGGKSSLWEDYSSSIYLEGRQATHAEKVYTSSRKTNLKKKNVKQS